MEDKTNLEELSSVKKYFEMLYHFKGEGLDKNRIRKEFKPGVFPFKTVSSKFRIIEENTKTILIVTEGRAAELLAELERKGFTKKLMREDFFVLKDPGKYSEEMGLTLDVEYGEAVIFCNA